METEKAIRIDHPNPEALQAHEGKWVALVGNEIISAGDRVTEVQAEASARGYREVTLYLVPSSASSLAPSTV